MISQHFEIPNKMETVEMAYSPTWEKLVLLQEPLTYNSDFYFFRAIYKHVSLCGKPYFFFYTTDPMSQLTPTMQTTL